MDRNEKILGKRKEIENLAKEIEKITKNIRKNRETIEKDKQYDLKELENKKIRYMENVMISEKNLQNELEFRKFMIFVSPLIGAVIGILFGLLILSASIPLAVTIVAFFSVFFEILTLIESNNDVKRFRAYLEEDIKTLSDFMLEYTKQKNNGLSLKKREEIIRGIDALEADKKRKKVLIETINYDIRKLEQEKEIDYAPKESTKTSSFQKKLKLENNLYKN